MFCTMTPFTASNFPCTAVTASPAKPLPLKCFMRASKYFPKSLLYSKAIAVYKYVCTMSKCEQCSSNKGNNGNSE